MFSMRLNEENQEEDSVLRIQRLMNAVALMLLLGLTESRRMIKICRFTLAAVEPACCIDRAYTACTSSACHTEKYFVLQPQPPLSMGNLTPSACMQQGILACTCPYVTQEDSQGIFLSLTPFPTGHGRFSRDKKFHLRFENVTAS